MPAGYRDSLDGLRAQLDAVRSDLASYESRLAVTPWCDIRRAWGIAGASPAQPTAALEFETIGPALDAARSRLETLRGFFARVPDENTAWTLPPPYVSAPPVNPVRSLWLDLGTTQPEASELRDWASDFARVIASVAPRAAVVAVEPDDLGWGTHFHTETMPIAIEARVQPAARNQAAEVRMQLTTSVALAAGPMRVRPQGMADELLAAVGLRRDIEFDDMDFDGMFFVRGDEPAVRAALVPAARTALLTIAREDVPRVEIEHGLATFEWRYPPTINAVSAALAAAAAIRNAPVVWPRRITR